MLNQSFFSFYTHFDLISLYTYVSDVTFALVVLIVFLGENITIRSIGLIAAYVLPKRLIFDKLCGVLKRLSEANLLSRLRILENSLLWYGRIQSHLKTNV